MRPETEAKKVALLAELEQKLAQVDHFQKTADYLKDLQKSWHEMGPATRENNSELNRNFRKLCDGFFEARKEFLKGSKEDKKKNLVLKNKLIERAEKLAEESDWQKALPRVRRLQEEWKESGPVPKEKADKIWARFKELCDQVLDKEHAEELEQQKANLLKKRELLEKFKEILAGTDMEKISVSVREFKNEWSDAGRVPREDLKEINKSFDELNKDFENRYAKAKDDMARQREENTRLKRELVFKAEALLGTPNAKETMEQLKESWNRIGASHWDKQHKKRFSLASAVLTRETVQSMKKKVELSTLRKESLCKRAEELAGLESKENSSINKDWFVAELQAKMGKTGQHKNKREEFSEILEEWEGTGFVDPSRVKELEERFEAAREKFNSTKH